MNSLSRIVFCSLYILVASGCSVDPASVNKNPPVTPPVFFKAGTLAGVFETKSAPVAFMWPLEENGQTLTRDEKIQKRADIVTELEILSIKGAEAKPFIDQLTALTGQFLQQQCGLFSEPPDASLQQVTVWKDPENDEEAAAIQACQMNMMERGQVLQENPVVQEAAQLKEKVFGITIGLQNLIPATSLKVDFSDLSDSGQPAIELFGFGGDDFSTSTADEFYEIRDVVLDRELGTLNFSVPYLQTRSTDDNLIYVGTYNFELEINESGGAVSLGGEIERVDNFRGTSALGRASFSGAIDQSPARSL